ncbi:MAG: hypothetical protein RUDDFDWM_001910 [Candidatus Fervidibacterota bacterium]
MGTFFGVLNFLFGIALILAMLFHITETETGGGGGMGWGTIGGRRISALQTNFGMETFIEKFITWIFIGFIVTAFLTAWFYRP